MILLCHSSLGAPLEAYHYKSRLIVLSFPQDADFQDVHRMLGASRDALEERNLKIIDVSLGGQRIPDAVRLPDEQTESVRRQLKIDEREAIPIFILIGKDGGEVARSCGTLNLEKWFALIDAMPMRQAEMQEQKSQRPP